MAIRIEIDEADRQELERLRTQLLGYRHTSGLSQLQTSTQAGRSHKWLSELEQGIGHPHFSSLQVWSAVFGLRVEPRFWDLPEWLPDQIPADVLLNWQLAYRMSRPFGAWHWCRAMLMADLVAYRHAAGVPAAQLSRRLGLSVSAVSGWERDGNDPLVSKVFTYVRALGGSVTFRLVTEQEWGQD